MIEKIKKITIVLVSYNSSKKIKKFIKKIPTITPIMIVDNSFFMLFSLQTLYFSYTI